MIYLKTSVGIEIRQDDLLISCLRSNFAAGVFTNHARIPGFRQRDPKEVRGEIDAFFKRERINRENVILGVPRRDVILRYLDLPKEVEDNLKQVVLYQVQSFEPTEEEKLYYDFVLLRNGQTAKRLHILLVMIRKSILDGHLELMRQFGIRPASVTAAPVALANMFLGTQDNGSGKIYILADLKQAGIELSVLRGGALVYAREAGRQDNAPWKQLLLSEIEEAVGKVRLDPEETIDGIVMTGEESASAQQELKEDVPGCELLGDKLRFEMPVRNRPYLQAAATSLGLAYSGITRRLPMKLNLLPFELRRHQKRWAYIPTIVFGLAVAAALAGLGLRQMVQERILIRNLDQQIESLKGPVTRVQAIRAQAESLEKQVSYIEDLLSRRDMNLEILQELTVLLPADTWLQSYRYSDCTMQMSGLSGNPTDLVPKLENSKLLRDVAQQGPIFRDFQSGKDRFTFAAKCER